MRARVLSELRSWNYLDRRSTRAPVSVPLAPAQARALARQDRERTVWFARGYIVYSMIGVLGLLWLAASDSHLAFEAITLSAVAMLAVALVLSYRAPLPVAGAVLMAVNVSLPVALTFGYSRHASFDLSLFGVGLAMLVFMFDAPQRFKVGFTFLLAGIYTILQFAPDDPAAAIDADGERIARMSLANNLLAVTTVLIAVLLLQMRFAATRRILEGTALYGEMQASTDELTGLVNRRPVHDLLDRLDQERTGDYAIAMIDIDEFKPVNDTYGHDCGDKVIAGIADALADSFRDVDLVARWGGDEFVVVLERILPSELAATLERVRAHVEGLPLGCEGAEIRVTLSIGAAHGAQGHSVYDCFAAADQYVYRSKQEGRNRVTIARELPVAGTSSRSADPED